MTKQEILSNPKIDDTVKALLLDIGTTLNFRKAKGEIIKAYIVRPFESDPNDIFVGYLSEKNIEVGITREKAAREKAGLTAIPE